MRKSRLPAVVAAVLVMTLALAPAVWAAEPGTKISNTLEATLTEDKESPSIKVHNDLSPTGIVGLWDVFSVSTEPGDYGGRQVRVKIELTEGTPDGFELEYLDVDSGTFKPLNFASAGGNPPTAWYGPAGGFQLADAVSTFRVTWKQDGTYTTKISIMAGPEFGETLATTDQTVSVAPAGSAIQLEWTEGDGDGDGKIDLTYTVDEEFTMSARASLADGLTHVDGVLYVIEVTRDGGQEIAPGDLEVTGTGGQSLGYDPVGQYFYWGPRTGFTFGCVAGAAPSNCAPDEAVTDFKVTIRKGGTYSVQAYAVQVPATTTGPLPGN